MSDGISDCANQGMDGSTAYGVKAPLKMVVHKLKIWPVYFAKVLDGSKPFEIRKNDRDFKVGDSLLLEEYDPLMEKRGKEGLCKPCGEYTGRKINALITYISSFEQQHGNVVLGIKRVMASN